MLLYRKLPQITTQRKAANGLYSSYGNTWQQSMEWRLYVRGMLKNNVDFHCSVNMFDI